MSQLIDPHRASSRSICGRSIRGRAIRGRALAALLIAVFAFVVAPTLLMAACSESSSARPVKTYTVRGEVRLIDTHREEIEIHHEAIPDFENYKGEKVGMAAMVMPFGLSDGLDLSDIEAGDKVEFTIAVDWDRKPAAHVSTLRELPADTQLNL